MDPSNQIMPQKKETKKRNGWPIDLGRCAYLLVHGEDGLPGGVEEHAAVADAPDAALELQHDGAAGVGDGEVAAAEARDLLGHRQRHHVRRAELRRHHHHRRRRLRQEGFVAGG